MESVVLGNALGALLAGDQLPMRNQNDLFLVYAVLL